MKTRNLLLALLILALWAATACSRPPQRNYLDSLRSYWQGVYPNGGETLYCGRKFRPFDRSVNVEHVYPMSWVTKKLGCGKREQCRHNSPRFNLIESDMHNMYPARKDVNQTRGAMAFGIIEGENHKYRGCDFEVDFRKRRVEPRPEVRGRIARAMLYMSDEYGLDIYHKQRKMLEKWNRQYPPDAEEKRHNRAVARIQGKPNPYIR
ncbi:MAG TPA: endonuclease I [Thiolapillus brandeum]|uniref:Endonuclease I n=1 Tax=Thiolapillus brandeum TaxID=1076588 RepID=A0A831WCR7_9GAMM|nr:endonuclease I [Thiolapillus brandeum]